MIDIKKMISGVEKDPKKMLIVITVSVIAGLVLYVMLVLTPQIVKIASLRVNLVKTRLELWGVRADIANIGSMKKAVEAYNEKVGKYEKTLPTEDDIPGLLESLAEMAKSSNLSIVGIVPVESKDDKPKGRVYSEIPIMISAKGGYHELGRFMSRIETSDRFIKIIDMQIKMNRPIPKKHDVELSVVTYILLEGK